MPQACHAGDRSSALSTAATILVCDCQGVYRVLVVHGLWLAAGRLALWGEESALPARPARRRGRPPREPQHPFAASHEALMAALGDAATKSMTGTVVLSLPTSGPS